MATLLEILGDPSAAWTRRGPASEAAITELVARCDFKLSDDYLTFLRYSNGGEGILCLEPGWFRICSAEEVIAYNRGYHVPQYLPDFFAIGSDGGDDILAIRKRDGSPCPIYLVPYIMAKSDVVQIMHDFEMFALALGR